MGPPGLQCYILLLVFPGFAPPFYLKGWCNLSTHKLLLLIYIHEKVQNFGLRLEKLFSRRLKNKLLNEFIGIIW